MTSAPGGSDSAFPASSRDDCRFIRACVGKCGASAWQVKRLTIWAADWYRVSFGPESGNGARESMVIAFLGYCAARLVPRAPFVLRAPEGLRKPR
jgi:hypothetical protein